MHEVFADPATAARSLTAEQRTEFLAAGPPQREAFPDAGLHAAAQRFYDELAGLSESD